MTFRKLAIILSDSDWLLFELKSFYFSPFYNSELDAVLVEVSKQMSQPTAAVVVSRLEQEVRI